MATNGKPIKSILRYYGGKWNLAPWIISHLPPHRIYVEPFGGAASVLLRKDRSFSEIYNDIDGEIVNLFRVLQDRSTSEELHRILQYTLFARDEFEDAYLPTDDPIEKARRLMIRSWMGHSTVGAHRKTGYRTNVKHVRRSTPARDWKRLIDHLGLIVERLQGVNIENKSATEVIEGHDCVDTVFYADAPYPHSTRNDKVYTFEMDDNDHRSIACCLKNIQGMALVSGYACDLYDLELYSDWHRVERQHYADGARERTEVLWISPAAWEASRTGPQQLELFP